MEVNGYKVEPGADLSGANLRDVDLRYSNLRNANLTEAELAGADLTGADLSNANLFKANLEMTILVGANLTEANLLGAKLNGVNLLDAKLDGLIVIWSNVPRIFKKLEPTEPTQPTEPTPRAKLRIPSDRVTHGRISIRPELNETSQDYDPSEDASDDDYFEYQRLDENGRKTEKSDSDNSFDPDNPYGDENIPLSVGFDVYNQIVKEFLGPEDKNR